MWTIQADESQTAYTPVGPGRPARVLQCRMREMAHTQSELAQQPTEAVMNNPDLVCAILCRANLSPEEFVSVGLVCKSWREACRQDESLIVAVAKTPVFLTKGTFMGLFALSPAEADQTPREVRPWRGGVMFMYRAAAVDAALPSIGGLDGRKRRLADRARKQVEVEQTFGPRWRETYWGGVGRKRVRPDVSMW
jgi:hypothetical protein